MAKKLNRTEQILIDAAKKLNHKIFYCKEHSFFSSKEGNNHCPYCKKECEEYKPE